MSAAEKLRALDAAAEAIALCLRNPVIPNIHDADARNALARIRNALPQIVAVVEAAETDLRAFGEQPSRALGIALAALDEALS